MTAQPNQPEDTELETKKPHEVKVIDETLDNSEMLRIYRRNAFIVGRLLLKYNTDANHLFSAIEAEASRREQALLDRLDRALPQKTERVEDFIKAERQALTEKEGK